MKTIDRKALLAALIMICGNGVVAMDLPGGDDGARGGGASGAASGAGVDSRHQAGFVVANMWAAMMEKTCLQERQIATMLTAIPALEPLREKLDKLTLQALQGIQSILSVVIASQSNMIEILKTFNASQIQAIGENAEILFIPGMAGYIREQIITALQPCNASQIKAIAANAQELFTLGINGYDRAKIISSLQDLDASRINVIGESRRCLPCPRR